MFDFAGTNTGGFRNDIKVDMSAPGAPPDLSFDMATDAVSYTHLTLPTIYSV